MERELLLLGFLRQAAMHGYMLNEFIERDMAVCTDLKKPTAYYLLDKMEKQGWITQHADQEGNRPARRVYAITPEGEQQFQQLLRENLSNFQPVKHINDIGMAFLDALTPAEALDLLNTRRDTLAAELATARKVPEHSGALQWIVRHHVYHLESEMRWLDEVINQLAADAKAG